jgi:hypothetical protein
MNPRLINYPGSRALCTLILAILASLLYFIGKFFGEKGVYVFISILCGTIGLFLIYWIIKVVIVFIRAFKE